MKRITKGLALSFGLLAVIARAAASGSFHPADLRCEYLRDPLGIDTPKPRLSL